MAQERRGDEGAAGTGNRIVSMPEDSACGSVFPTETVPHLVKNHRQSVETEMDKNKVVTHFRHDRTAEGVTPSDPNALAHLFHEMSIGSANWMMDGSETGSTTGEGEESSEHAQPGTAAPTAATGEWGGGASGATVEGGESATVPSETAPLSADNLAGGTRQDREQQTRVQVQNTVSKEPQQGSGAAKKLFARVKPDSPTRSHSTGVTETTETDRKKSGPSKFQSAADPQGKPLPAAQAHHCLSVATQPKPEPAKETLVVPPLPTLQHRISASEAGDTSHATAPLRRKTSMGSFQRGMGESLTGRLRKQLDIPQEPKVEVNTNVSIDQIQNLQYLAQGAMCVAYTAILHGKQVVLKTPLPDTSHADVAANDLEVEMLLLKELHHDNIVKLLGAGFFPDKRRFVALEYLSGGTLSKLLKTEGNLPLGITKVLDLSLALCNALEYLHDVAVPGRIVCHRDLKPDNIAFSADGTLKLIDFGLGKIIKRKFRVRADSYHMTGGTGSLRYMAPEVADHQKYNEKADVYSFSLIMWEMLAGVKPFLGLKRADFYTRVVDQGERPHLDPAWPEHVRNLLESCWRTNLDERLSFREVAGILKVCAEEENRRLFEHRSIRISSRRTRLWSSTGPRPGGAATVDDIPYKPKFKISSFFQHSQRHVSQPPAQASTSKEKKKKSVRRSFSHV